ncbi:MAG TPA: D-glycero-beta-D-manno-heptose 1-phosphate adenylyltransferase [candidate division WOR-3 bacterium]|uniref:D-glycero-beta-D-manno-heptose 1-phosphate adenylyltransferase n=1 Tax=candidate division WOR-3 bacterium TaxID=2052148 RepID=A0A7C5HJ58_UNCW3|nr:D-glycero-beta-D-manno-heptose 1-phosphate adenylyltransferase [candidate division WOR-3 bacterium]
MIIKREDIKRIVSSIREEGKKVVFTNGCFDLIHPGHITLLREAKKKGVLIVGINTDESIRKIKEEQRPIVPLKARMEVLDSIKYVDYIIPFSEETPIEIIKMIVPDIIVKGGDWKENEIVGAELVKKRGGEVVRIRYKNAYSTSEIINTIKRRYCEL